MKAIVNCLGIALLIVGFVLVGCDKKPADAAKPADTTAKAEPAKVDDAAKAADDVAKAADKAADVLAAAGAGNADDAPEYLKKMIDHMKKINQLTKDNLTDCAKVTAEVKKYVADNEAALAELKKEAEESQKKMSDEQKAKMAGSVMALIGPVMQEMMTTQMEFSKKCPEESVALNEAMKNLKMR